MKKPVKKAPVKVEKIERKGEKSAAKTSKRVEGKIRSWHGK